MVLLGLLAAMMLAASPVLAHQGGPNHGNKYSKNYYPNGYFNYCEPDGAKYYGKKKVSPFQRSSERASTRTSPPTSAGWAPA
jgi:hypothetical protein